MSKSKKEIGFRITELYIFSKRENSFFQTRGICIVGLWNNIFRAKYVYLFCTMYFIFSDDQAASDLHTKK